MSKAGIPQHPGGCTLSNRNVYLKMTSLSQAREIIFSHVPVFGKPETEEIAAPDAVGRVLAAPVFARVSAPNFHAAAMDGIAVNAARTLGASEASPKTLTIGKDAFFVNTGHILPENTDAVIMIENVNLIDASSLNIEAPAYPWQNIRKMGEDIVATELIFPRNHRVTPCCVGALLGGGIFTVTVRKQPKAAILPTGSEMVDWKKTPLMDIRAGQVIESNSYVLAGLVASCGGVADKRPILPDDTKTISEAIMDALSGECDMALTVGGSSAGSEDYIREVVASIGEVLVHGVTIMPGKPLLIGKVLNKPVFGMPGYPVSTIVAFDQFVRPLLYRYQGQAEPEKTVVQAELTRKMPSKLGVEEFVRVKLGRVGKRIIATSLPRGAGSITSITEADGMIRIPANSEGLPAETLTPVELLRPASALDQTVVIVGSHDMTLNILADLARKKAGGVAISSSHVGSMGGLMAIKRGGCHMAGSHLLDTADGTYNVAYVKRFLPDIPVRIVHLVFREQGLILAKGNPKGIQGIGDLARKDVRFINRQAGSGTRILLDYRLGQLSIDPKDIQGYESDEYTHMAVAAAVLSARADAGLGICAAARALDLDFIPVVAEQYDLIIPQPYFDSDKIQYVLEIIASDEFKRSVEALGGYDTRQTGTVVL